MDDLLWVVVIILIIVSAVIICGLCIKFGLLQSIKDLLKGGGNELTKSYDRKFFINQANSLKKKLDYNNKLPKDDNNYYKEDTIKYMTYLEGIDKYLFYLYLFNIGTIQSIIKENKLSMKLNIDKIIKNTFSIRENSPRYKKYNDIMSYKLKQEYIPDELLLSFNKVSSNNDLKSTIELLTSQVKTFEKILSYFKQLNDNINKNKQLEDILKEGLKEMDYID